MKCNIPSACLSLFLLIPLALFTQERTKTFSFPDIPSYRTLVCDLHMHSVFSDGLVWPTVRIDEALKEGVEVIALTEHIEYRPYSGHITGDHNQAWEVAADYAEKKGIVLIRGAEITRSMPPGHFNAIFLQDANELDQADWRDALGAAREQGAFIFWNHPGWRQENEIPLWYKEHSWLLHEKLIQGIEIVNERSYYPLAYRWALDSGLCILGNSDIHDPTTLFFDYCDGEHRPVTLVFAEDTDQASIRDAMLDHRTAVYYNDMMLGEEKWLRALFSACVPGQLAMHIAGGERKPEMSFMNHSCFSFVLERSGSDSPKQLILDPGNNHIPDSHQDISGKWIVKNLFIAPGINLEVEL